MSKNLRRIKDALCRTGLPWEIKQGSRHKKIFLADKMIGVVCTNGNASRGRDTDQIERAIAARVKEVKCRAESQN